MCDGVPRVSCMWWGAVCVRGGAGERGMGVEYVVGSLVCGGVRGLSCM